MYDTSAGLYDLIYRDKDYRAEADAVLRLVAAHVPRPRALLDVACGTGRHLEAFRERVPRVEGIDLSTGLLDQARRRLPGVSLHAADMRNFMLPRRFDVVTCLFSAIGYVPHVGDLHGAVARMAAHLEPGGVLLVEPWLRPDQWEVGRVSIQTAAEDGRAVARMTVSDIEGEVAVMDMHHLVGTPTGVEHAVERHRLTLFRHQAYLAAFEAAGLAVHHEAHGVSGRGAYIGVGATTGQTGAIA